MAQKLDRRQELLRAGRAVFAEKGYHEAKIDDIVASAGVAKGTFYLYFRDKRALFAELVDGLFTRLGGAILRVDTDADIESQIKHNIRAIVAVLLDDPALTSILLSYSAGLDQAFVSQVRSFHEGVKQLLAGSLRWGQQLGIVASGDPALYATFTIGALKELLFENALGEHPRPREAMVTALFDLLRQGYLRTGEASAALTPAAPSTAAPSTAAPFTGAPSGAALSTPGAPSALVASTALSVSSPHAASLPASPSSPALSSAAPRAARRKKAAPRASVAASAPQTSPAASTPKRRRARD
ncbi:TetR/AcrR family transcriptional regulator [Chondromyces apiculatus]|uniref:Transcriptional regulator (TetR/AcrR family) n=1 Tax=Chondromyces apiculatus DSM 436 TaxID=1192034 RepID=A0A017T8X0_9BACT|nr:TetR/AcrR family transcriptional regulator [Chondromyces apiculatus]EYF05708.1 transcriptional regulator (TetR/AcrR family) [Chondromyces apiculatus DSM 436]